jgi:cell division inhibitor SepF
VAIAEVFRKIGDMVMDGFREDPFEMMNEDEDDGGYYGEEVEPGTSAVRAFDYDRAPEQKPERKLIKPEKFNRGGSEIVIMEPHSFDDVVTFVQELKDRKILMLNLQLLDNNQSQRTIDYLCGAAQALNAQPKKTGDRYFIFAPSNVTVTADASVPDNKYSENSAWRTTLR